MNACMTKETKRKSTFKCPHCQSPCKTTNSKNLSDTYKESYVYCTNDACGGRYVFGSEPVRELTPSQTPNPLINLPRHLPPHLAEA